MIIKEINFFNLFFYFFRDFIFKKTLFEKLWNQIGLVQSKVIGLIITGIMWLFYWCAAQCTKFILLLDFFFHRKEVE